METLSPGIGFRLFSWGIKNGFVAAADCFVAPARMKHFTRTGITATDDTADGAVLANGAANGSSGLLGVAQSAPASLIGAPESR
jgi:hypothetical protein